MSRKIKIDICSNLLKAIIKIVESVNIGNSKFHTVTCPGEAVKKAFGIDLVKIHENEISKGVNVCNEKRNSV